MLEIRYSGPEALIIFEDASIPNEMISMDGETEFSALLVERFTAVLGAVMCARVGWAMCSSGPLKPWRSITGWKAPRISVKVGGDHSS